jgi:hypothetical protein
MARIRRVRGPAAVATGPTTVYTVGAGLRAVMRHIHVSNTSAGAVTFTMSIGADAAGTRIFDAYTIAAGAVLDHYCAYQLAAAEIVTVSAGTNNILVLTIDAEEEII